MRTLNELKPGEIAIVDCINIDDQPYHDRLKGVGLRCLDQIKCLHSMFGMKHLAVGMGFTTEFALREITCKEIWIR